MPAEWVTPSDSGTSLVLSGVCTQRTIPALEAHRLACWGLSEGNSCMGYAKRLSSFLKNRLHWGLEALCLLWAALVARLIFQMWGHSTCWWKWLKMLYRQWRSTHTASALGFSQGVRLCVLIGGSAGARQEVASQEGGGIMGRPSAALPNGQHTSTPPMSHIHDLALEPKTQRPNCILF